MTGKEALKAIKMRRVNIPMFRARCYIHFAENAGVIRDAYGFDKADFAGVTWVDGGDNINIAFSEEHMDIPAFAHEAVHAANRLCENLGYEPQRDNDEILAYFVSFFVDAMLDAQHKLGVGKMEQQG